MTTVSAAVPSPVPSSACRLSGTYALDATHTRIGFVAATPW
jgi:polyisoprenoid-binding protein YceI